MALSKPSEQGHDRYDPKHFSDYLPLYYSKLFPSSTFYKWLTYGGVDKTMGQNREISFTLEDDVYLRFQSFSEQKDLEKALRDKNPHKIDIGAIYNRNPKLHHHESTFAPREKELVFDIDMTDYDEVRTCCQGADICNNCWLFMTLAMQILDRTLREDFGFEHILWVYSGRRGVHCWVCDAKARKLHSSARSAIANYVSVIKGGAHSSKKVSIFKTIHPSIKASLKILKKSFSALTLENQRILEDDKFWHGVISHCPDESSKEEMRKCVLSPTSSEQRWTEFVDAVERLKRKNLKCQFLVEEVMLELCYPRLDIAVTKGVQHLLKAPFCVHPKTGRVCVPIDVTNVHAFDPTKVPTVCDLFNEIDAYDANQKESENTSPVMKDYKKTSLAPSISLFQHFVNELSSEWKGKLIEISDKSQQF